MLYDVNANLRDLQLLAFFFAQILRAQTEREGQGAVIHVNVIGD